MKTLTIECYDFPEFCKRMQDVIQEGYEFDFESNERFPTSFGGYYNVVLVKRDKTKEDKLEVVISDTVITDELARDLPAPETKVRKNAKKVT